MDTLDLFGWQTVFAVTYPVVNTAIAEAKSTPAGFDYTDTDAGLAMSGTWATWQVVDGGAGPGLQLQCPVTTGTVTLAGRSTDLSGGVLQIQVDLDLVPDPEAPVSDPTTSGGMPHHLVVRRVGSATHPAVAVVGTDFANVSGLLADALPAVFAAWFNEHIAEFNHVFATLVLNGTAAQGDYQWLKPTATGYACANAPDGADADSVLGVLCMTDTPAPPALSHQVDPRLVFQLPEPANSAFAISSRDFLGHVLAKGAALCIQGASVGDFVVTDDEEWIVNTADLVWGDFALDDGTIVSPTIKAQNFQMGLQGGKIVTRITDASFAWPKWKAGTLTVHLNLTQEFGLSLRQTDAGWLLVPTAGVATKELSANITADGNVLTFDILIGIGGAVLGAIVGAVAGAALQAVADVVTDATTGASIAVSREALDSAAVNLSDVELNELDQVAAKQGGEAITAAANDTGFVQKFSAALQANKWKTFGGAIGALVGAQLGTISRWVQVVANGDVENLPTLSAFAANAVGSTTWPATTRWEPVSVELPGAFVLTGKLS